MKVRFEWTIPNALSILRLLLIPVFAVLYLTSGDHPERLYWSVGALLLSGLSDALDGYIARRFNQISESGKLLDPLADKLTQVTVLVCVTVRCPALIPLLITLITLVAVLMLYAFFRYFRLFLKMHATQEKMPEADGEKRQEGS